MINIQIHGVKTAKWEPLEDPAHPRVLVIETEDGVQAITMFPARPKKASVEPPAGPVGPPVGGGSPAAGTVSNDVEPTVAIAKAA